MLITINDFTELFNKGGMEITPPQYERFAAYAKLLVEWNEKINLTAITDPEGIAQKHFFDSVYPFTLAPLPEGARVIDVGTGAGFPSCPLKIMRDDIDLTLLDSLNKRIKFLETLSGECRLDAQCIHARAEDGGKRSDLRESFDIACARAVAPMYILSEYCLPFVKVGGAFYALKGSGGSDELTEAKEAIKRLGGKTETVKEYTLPNGDGRTLIVIRKVSPTPAKYPRPKAKIVR
ncbi:MAG: 16S rRNA (guanine(527)-N(7))-methyltransferase RsmG [Ruminococcus sp.]|nr:16S rRNA (guanine(527)-N(7))-methyltransferase RsmG [Ruminococcus sp.]